MKTLIPLPQKPVMCYGKLHILDAYWLQLTVNKTEMSRLIAAAIIRISMFLSLSFFISFPLSFGPRSFAVAISLVVRFLR